MPTCAAHVLLGFISNLHLVPLNLHCESMNNYLVEGILIVQCLIYLLNENFVFIPIIHS